MANFIEKTLEPGEKVIFKGRLHWSYNFRYTAWGFLLILLSVAGMVVIAYTHYNDFNNNNDPLYEANDNEGVNPMYTDKETVKNTKWVWER